MSDNHHINSFKTKLYSSFPFMHPVEIDNYIRHYDGRITVHGYDE